MVKRKKQATKAVAIAEERLEEQEVEMEKEKEELPSLEEFEEKPSSDKDDSHLSLIEDDLKEEKRLERLRIASTGSIPDARVYRLMYLEKCAIEASLQIQVRRTAYETRIQALRQELSAIVRQWEATQKQSVRKISDVRREIQEDYGIHMDSWGYDEETGVLQKLPAEVLESVKSEGKLKESDNAKSDKSSET